MLLFFGRLSGVEFSVALFDAASSFLSGNDGADMDGASTLACSGDLPLRLASRQGENPIAEAWGSALARGWLSDRGALRPATAQGRLIFYMFSALAEFERSLIRERTQAGLAVARRIGRTGGRPPQLTADDIEAAKAMLTNPEIRVDTIARRLGVSTATLYRHIPAARTVSAEPGSSS